MRVLGSARLGGPPLLGPETEANHGGGKDNKTDDEGDELRVERIEGRVGRGVLCRRRGEGREGLVCWCGRHVCVSVCCGGGCVGEFLKRSE